MVTISSLLFEMLTSFMEWILDRKRGSREIIQNGLPPGPVGLSTNQEQVLIHQEDAEPIRASFLVSKRAECLWWRSSFPVKGQYLTLPVWVPRMLHHRVTFQKTLGNFRLLYFENEMNYKLIHQKEWLHSPNSRQMITRLYVGHPWFPFLLTGTSPKQCCHTPWADWKPNRHWLNKWTTTPEKEKYF